MNIKFLKAGTGDCILLHHKKQNIVIDGGSDSKYLLAEVDKIYRNGELIDLLVITHHDDDHIKGIIDLLNHVNENKYNEEKQFIKKVIFNSPRLTLGKISKLDSKLLSYHQAYEVEELLMKINTEWKKHTDKDTPMNFDDLSITLLSPNEEDLKEYSLQKGAYLSGDWKCDWESPMLKLEPYIDDSSQDKSISNKSSVVLQIECEGKRVLLTGDVTPDRLETILGKLYENSGGNPLEFDIIKLPHHGSYRSINQNILQKIKCNNFIVSTNSKKYFLPNKRALLKVLKFSNRINNEPANFIFNYEETLSKLGITQKEKIDYNFILTPNNEIYGISL